MKEIPDITFRKRTNPHLEFEIFPLQHLFRRQTQLQLPHRIDKPHRVHFFIILFITKGNGRHFVDFQSYLYQPATAFFISKGQVHAFEINLENDGFMLLFTEAFLQKHFIQSDTFSFYRLYNYHVYAPVIQPDDMGNDEFFTIINNMQQEYTCQEDSIKEHILACLLKLLLLRAERMKAADNPKISNSPWYHTFLLFKHALETHYTTTRDANDYADLLHISYKHLNVICKEFTSLTAKQFIVQWIVLEIKRQLASSELSVKEIAYQSGFDEPTNLVKFFKHRTGQTPAQFRHSL